MEDLLPDVLKKLWGKVEDGRLSADEFDRMQDSLVGEYRRIWEDALLLEGFEDLQESVVSEIGSYLGRNDSTEIKRLCCQALAHIKGEWQQKVDTIDKESVEQFYDQSQAMIYELMWWHTLVDDLSPLAYVVALKLAQRHECGRCLDFGSGVGSGGILFARHGMEVTLADISSTALDFSSWRFERRGLPSVHLDLKNSRLPEAAFDFITAMDVFEHLVNPVETVRDVDRALKQGGFLFGRFHAEADEDRPHHIILDFQPTLKELQARGFVRVWQDEWLWGHEVYRKMP